MANIFDLIFGITTAKAQPVVLTAEEEYISRLARDLGCTVDSLSFLVGDKADAPSELEIPHYRRAA